MPEILEHTHIHLSSSPDVCFKPHEPEPAPVALHEVSYCRHIRHQAALYSSVLCLQVEDAQRWHVVLQLLGLRTQGLAAAVLLPVLLTALLFLGPLSLLYFKWLSRRHIEQLDRSLLEVYSQAKHAMAQISSRTVLLTTLMGLSCYFADLYWQWNPSCCSPGCSVVTDLLFCY